MSSENLYGHLPVGKSLLHCTTCSKDKNCSFFNHGRANMCTACYKLGSEWNSDPRVHRPFMSPMAQSIDYAVVQCPLCDAQLWREEIKQNGDKFPCCQYGISNITVTLPSNYLARSARFSGHVVASANDKVSSIATTGGKLKKMSVIGLPKQKALYSDLMSRNKVGVILLFCLKHDHMGQLSLRRPYLNEFSKEFTIQFDEGLESTYVDSPVYGFGITESDSGFPSVCAVLNPNQGGVRNLLGYMGTATGTESKLTNELRDILSSPVLFIKRAPREDAVTGASLSEASHYRNLAWRNNVLWPHENLRVSVSQFMIRGWIQTETERLADGIRLRNAINSRSGFHGKALPQSFMGSMAYTTFYRNNTFEALRIHGPPTVFLTYTYSVTEGMIAMGFSKSQIKDKKFLWLHSDLVVRDFMMKWRQLLASLDSGELAGAVNYRSSGIESQREGLIHGHLNLNVKEAFRSAKHVESFVVACLERCPPHLRRQISILHRHDCSKANCMVNGRCVKCYPFTAPSVTGWTMKNGMSFCQYLRGYFDTRTVPFSTTFSTYMASEIDGELCLPHCCPLVVDGCTTTKYVIKYPLKLSLRCFKGVLVQWENKEINEEREMRNSKVASNFEVFFDLLFGSKDNGNNRFDVKVRLPYSQALSDVVVLPVTWLETSGSIGNQLMAYLYRPAPLRALYYLEFCSLYKPAYNRRTRKQQAPTYTVEHGAKFFAYFAVPESERFVYRFERTNDLRNVENYWRKMVLENCALTAGTWRGSWTQTASAALDSVCFTLGNNTLNKGGNNIIGYLEHLLETESRERVLKHVTMMQDLMGDQLSGVLPRLMEILSLSDREIHSLGLGMDKPRISHFRTLTMSDFEADIDSVVLNRDQKRALKKILRSSKNIILIKGQAGTGKTVLATVAAWNLLGRKVTMCAMSWEATKGLPGAVSFHQLFGLRPGRWTKMSDLTEEHIAFLRSLNVIFVDETFLACDEWLSNASALLQEIHGVVGVPFAGCKVIFLGCDKQITCVVDPSEFESELLFCSEEQLQKQISASNFFENNAQFLERDELFENERYKSDPAFGLAMQQLASGAVKFIDSSRFQNIAFGSVPCDTITRKDQAVVCGTHAECHIVAKELTRRYALTRGLTLHTEFCEDYTVEDPCLSSCFSKRNLSGLQPSELFWTEGMMMSLMLNVMTPDGEYLTAKTLLRVLGKKDKAGPGGGMWVQAPSGNIFALPQVSMTKIVDGVEVCRHQYPLRWAGVCTIDAVQGKTLSKVFIYGRRSFGHGRTYVMLSRCRERSGVYFIKCENSEMDIELPNTQVPDLFYDFDVDEDSDEDE